MDFSSDALTKDQTYKLIVSTVVPRPIAFVTTISADGILNAAPFSYFNVMGSAPPVVSIGFEPKPDGSMKDTPRNILDTGEFVVNIVDEALAVKMNMCAAMLPPQVSEIDVAELETSPSTTITPPRLSASPVSFECTVLNTTKLSGGGIVVLGEIKHFHLRDEIISQSEPLRIDLDKLDAISRLNGPYYGRTTDRFELKRPT